MNTRGTGAVRGLLWLLVGALLAPCAWAGVGTVERIRGTVSVELPQGGSKPLALGDSVEENQGIRTGPDGEAVVRFADNAVMIVRSGTQLRVATYRYRENDGGNASLIKLLKGGLRFATGLMGKVNRDSVRFDTPVATIGVRGTDFDTVYLEERTDGLDAGSYTCVTEGGTWMRDSAGKEVEIAQGQTGFMTSADFIARGIAAAASIGVIPAPSGLFRAGTFDGQMQDLKQEGLRQLQYKVNENVPSELRSVIPAAGDMVSGAGEMLGSLFKKKNKGGAAGGPCAS